MTRSTEDEQAGQRLAALRLANDARSARAELKRDIATGAVSVIEALDHPRPPADRRLVTELLVSQPGCGRAARLLAPDTIGEAELLGDLTARQRHLLAGRLASR
jgi:hypothetical protein